jgi:hypothetical protein
VFSSLDATPSSVARAGKAMRPGWRDRAAAKESGFGGKALASFPAPCGESLGNTILTTVNIGGRATAQSLDRGILGS